MKSKADILRIVKRHLATGARSNKDDYICHAAMAAWVLGDIGGEEYAWVRRLMESYLGLHGAIEIFLRDKGLISSYSRYFLSRRERDLIQQYRHRWLDHLIREFEEGSISAASGAINNVLRK